MVDRATPLATLAGLLEDEMEDACNLGEKKDLREGLGLDWSGVVGLVMPEGTHATRSHRPRNLRNGDRSPEGAVKERRLVSGWRSRSVASAHEPLEPRTVAFVMELSDRHASAGRPLIGPAGKLVAEGNGEVPIAEISAAALPQFRESLYFAAPSTGDEAGGAWRRLGQDTLPRDTKGLVHIMDRTTLLGTLVGLLQEEMGDIYNLDEATELREGLGLDSVDVVGLVMRVEQHFRIRLAMEELMEVKRVEQLLSLIEAKLAARNGAPLPALHELRTSAA